MTLAYFSLFLGISASLLGQELSRKEAERIIDSVEGFRQANSFNLPRDRQACGERQGLWRTGQWAFEIGPKGRSFLKAVRYNAATGNLMVTTIGAHNRYVRAITGVSDAQNGLKQADFFFEWQWIGVSAELTDECLRMPPDFQTAHAFFKHYDDGWRLVTINVAE